MKSEPQKEIHKIEEKVNNELIHLRMDDDVVPGKKKRKKATKQINSFDFE